MTVLKNNGTFSGLTSSDIPTLSQGLTGYFYQSAGAAIQRITDRIFVGGAVANDGNVQSSSSGDWLSALRNYSTSIGQFVSLSTIGQIAGVFGSRSSDSATTDAEGTIAVEGIVNNDNTANTQYAFAGYFEARRQASAGWTHGVEIDIVNLGSVVTYDPFSYGSLTPHASAGGANCLHVASGAGVSGAQTASSAITILNNGAAFNAGITFVNGALANTNSDAIAMRWGNNISWYYQAGAKNAYLDGTGGQLTQSSDTAGTGVYWVWGRQRFSSPYTTQSLDVISKISFQGDNAGTGYELANWQITQRSAFSGGNASGSHDINAANGDGTVSQVTLNGMGTKSFCPYPDNSIALGLTSFRWTQLSAATATINTSDRTLKTDIADIPDDLIDAFDAVRPRIFRWKDAVEKKGDDARIHSGYIAQEWEAALRNAGLDAERYALFCKDLIFVPKERMTTDGEGREQNIVESVPDLDANGVQKVRYGLRYELLIAIMDASSRRRARTVEARLQALESLLKK